MHAELTADLAEGSVASRVRRSQIELLYKFPERVAGHIINALLVAIVLWREIPAALLLGWLTVVVLVGAVRLFAARAFERRENREDVGPWARWFAVGSTASAALWGCSSAVVWISPDITYHVFLAFIIAGTCSAATTMTYPYLPALYAFLLASAAPLAAAFVAVGESTYLVMGLMTVLLSLLMVGQARSANAIMLQALTLQEENRLLVGDLSRARDTLEARVRERTTELDRANASLRDEMAARLETESRLLQAQKMEAIGQLTGGVAHDFNNLLAVIQGNAELLSEMLEDGRGGREIQAVLRASARGAQLTQRLLAFSRKQTLQPCAVNVNDLVTAMLDMLGRTIGASVTVTFIPGGAVPPAHVDPGQLENAILNLAINARDAMPKGGAITIATSKIYLSGDENFAASISSDELKPGEYVTVAVSDTGTGIAPELLDKVWEPFYTTKRAGEGTGLGLSMVYGFIRQSGGQVSIDSEPGLGTTVRMSLPRAAAEPNRAETVEITGVPRGDEYVFVLEDDADIRDMLYTYLRRLGYRVEAAGTAEEAYEVLAAHGRPDVIVSDIVLPAGHRGPRIVAGARRQFGPIPVVFMSGHASGGVSGADGIGPETVLVDKPFALDHMARCVRAALDGAEKP